MSPRPGRRSSTRALAGSAVLALATVSPTDAHHSILPFDGTRTTTIHGVVVRFVWQNPHTHIYLDVTNEHGAVEQWAIESEGANALRRLGWTTDLIVAGDRLTLTGARAKNGAAVMRCKTIQLRDGRRFACQLPVATPSKNH